MPFQLRVMRQSVSAAPLILNQTIFLDLQKLSVLFFSALFNKDLGIVRDDACWPFKELLSNVERDVDRLFF